VTEVEEEEVGLVAQLHRRQRVREGAVPAPLRSLGCSTRAFTWLQHACDGQT
jgi:hypothetical protein